MLRNNPSGNTWARPCDTCASSPSRVYCRADAAYLCSACDSRVHAANQVASRHERVWVCEACERAPAAFLCKADAASLCAACDSDIHSANPLARRHHRLPILPLSGPSSAAPGTKRGGATLAMAMAELEDGFDEEDEDEAASWLLPNPSTNTDKTSYKTDIETASGGCFVGSEVDEYLDLVEYTSSGAAENSHQTHTHYKTNIQYDIIVPNGDVEFDIKSGFPFNTSSISHNVSVSSSSPEVGIVPESTVSDISTTHPKGTIDLFSCPPLQQVPMQLSPMERQARVMRYWEKKKARKFEKTIRYASRKAYAEKRPRIKGRFAKRTDAEDHQVDQMFAINPIMSDAGYGIVPSF